jgi:general secretion pathway protein E
LCPECRRAHPPDADERELLGIAEKDTQALTIYSPAGCPACVHTGYQGRTGVFELLPTDDELRQLIHDGSGEPQLRAHGQKLGMKGIREDGIRWVLSGVTSVEEVLRVARE